MRVALWIIGVVFAISVAGLGFLYSRLDGVHLTPRLQEEVRTRTQRELGLAGTLGVSLFPRIAITVPAATLSERGSTQPFARIDSARIAVALLPLLRGHVEADTVTIDGLQATLVRDRDGRLNIDDLLGRQTASAPAAPTAPPAPSATESRQTATDIQLAGVRLSRAALTLRDLKTGEEIRLTDLNLSTSRIAPRSEPDFELATRFASGANTGEFKASGVLELDLPAARYGVRKLATSGTGTWDHQAFDLKLASPQWAIAPERSESAGADLELKLGTLAATIKIGPFGGPRAAITAENLALQVRLGGAGRELALQAAGPARADLDTLAFHLPALKGSLQVQNPGLPKPINAPLDASVSAALREKLTQLKLATRLDDAPARLEARVQGYAVPAIDFTLDAARLDLDPWLASAPRKTAALSLISAAHATPAANFAWLSDLKLSGEVRIGELKVQGLRAAEVSVTLRSEAGRLRAAPVSASLYGGRFKGSAWLRSDAGAGADGALSRIDLAALLRDLGGQGQLEGRANVDFDLSTRLADPAAWKRALAGRAAVKIEQGAIRGVNLERILSAARRGQGGLQTQRSNEADKTEFSELSASFSIDRGVARNADLRAISAVLRLTGEGEINLAEDRIDYVLRAALSSSAQRAARLTVPVKVSGPFADIHYSVDWSALAAAALQNELQRRLRPEGGSDAPLDALRKLFKP